ncbi:hypothetical protein ACIQPQ_06160 [Streptomyces sp. NPDC091281]|uniref:hypothetical protein n=1 Tax=Streptomyces sp. NPDC091281 TaxID=3365985 RepID=UPI0038001F0A
MEQRIGSSSQPLEGAGFDPAFIPGLTSPVTAEPADAKPKDAPSEDAEAGTDAKSGEDAAGSAADGPADDGAVAAPAVADSAADSGADDEETPDGPAFEAADRRARIVADARGVRLRLDAEECEFRWDEIGAIETESPRFGKRFTITVHTPERRWYPIEIEATSRDRFKEWDEQLDAVLDAYFDDGAEASDGAETPEDSEDPEGTEPDVGSEPETDAAPEATDAAGTHTADTDAAEPDAPAKKAD